MKIMMRDQNLSFLLLYSEFSISSWNPKSNLIVLQMGYKVEFKEFIRCKYYKSISLNYEPSPESLSINFKSRPAFLGWNASNPETWVSFHATRIESSTVACVLPGKLFHWIVASKLHIVLSNICRKLVLRLQALLCVGFQRNILKSVLM